MDRFAVFVDAGYLYAASANLVQGTNARSDAPFDYDKVIQALQDFGIQATSREMLRIYWYNGTSSGPSSTHIALAYKAGIKLRLGFVNTQGQQKGVDSLIVTDMIELARNRAISDAILLSGDEDVRVGVQQAQMFGVRVHLLGIAPRKNNQSNFLLQESDDTAEWDSEKVTSLFRDDASASGQFHVVPAVQELEETGEETLESVAIAIANEIPASDVEAAQIEISSGSIPREWDGQLLSQGAKALGGVLLDAKQKREVRDHFRKAVENRGP